MKKWTEFEIAKTLAMEFFNKEHLVVVDNCGWSGHEADILAVTRDLRLIDVEIKISRQDLKADASKSKWRHYGALSKSQLLPNGMSSHPHKIWKHYYALPAEIWKPELFDSLPSIKSGVVLLSTVTLKNGKSVVKYKVVRKATPNRNAEKISTADVLNVARLASLRMWSHRTKT